MPHRFYMTTRTVLSFPAPLGVSRTFRPTVAPESVSGMSEKCQCAKPILREHAEAKGSSESYCARCKRPIGLRLAAVTRAA